MNTSQIINLHFCTTLSQNAQRQDLILSFSGRVTWAALDNPKIRAADEFPSKGRLLQAGDRNSCGGAADDDAEIGMAGERKAPKPGYSGPFPWFKAAL